MCRYLAGEVTVIRYQHIAVCQSLYSYILSCGHGGRPRRRRQHCHILRLLRLGQRASVASTRRGQEEAAGVVVAVAA